jgi:hypothetical protein
MTKMTAAEFEAAVIRNRLPLDAAKTAELHTALGKLEAMIERVTRPKPREVEPALIFVPGNVP